MPDAAFQHTLVIGGTGMLADCTRQLASRSETITLVARHPDALSDLEADRVEHVAVDYHHTDALLDRLTDATDRLGPFDFAVTWIHQSADDSLRATADLLNAQPNTPRHFDVQSSGIAPPADTSSARHRYLETLDDLRYRRVLLGFVRDDGDSRWLTDREISSGVLDALARDEPRHVVGRLEPWNQRP